MVRLSHFPRPAPWADAFTVAYNAFARYGQNNKQWCGNHRLNYKALSRAMSIRKQLKKYMERFRIPIVSCEGDAVRLRKCLVSGYFKVSKLPALREFLYAIWNLKRRLYRTRPRCCQTERTARLGKTRLCMCILHRSCSLVNHPQVG